MLQRLVNLSWSIHRQVRRKLDVLNPQGNENWFEKSVKREITDYHKGRFPFTKKFPKFRLGCKWTRLFGSSHWKFSGINGISEKVAPLSRWKLPIYRISRLYRQFHAFRGFSSGQTSLGSLVFPKNGGLSGSGFWKLFANKHQGYYEYSVCHVLASDHENLLQHECASFKSSR